MAGALGATSVFALTGAVLAPSFPEHTYYGGWTPRFAHLQWYGGRVLEASLDELEIPPGVIAHSPHIRERLLSGATLLVRARAGPRPAGPASLLTINDAHRREILFLGVEGEDVVYRYRTRAMDRVSSDPEIRSAGGASRDRVARSPVRHRAASRSGAQCPRERHRALWARPHAGNWLAVLFFPIGLWARPGVVPGAGAALALARPADPARVHRPHTDARDGVLGALAGFLAGWAISRYTTSRDRPEG